MATFFQTLVCRSFLYAYFCNMLLRVFSDWLSCRDLAARLVFSGVLAGLTAATGTAQEAPAADGRRHQNRFDRVFLPVPGIAVLVAATETTAADFAAFVSASGYAWSYRPPFPQQDDHPAVGINLKDAQAFCEWLTETERAAGTIAGDQTYRLPTSLEWSAAAGLAWARKRRAELTTQETLADLRRFPWGTQWPPPENAANLAEWEIAGFDDAFEFTAPVGSFQPSLEGLYDLAGNVWEWTRETGQAGRGKLRGGSWAYFKEECLRSEYEYEAPEDLRAPTVGFRVVFEDSAHAARLLAGANKETGKPPDISSFASLESSPSDPEELAVMRQRLAGAAGDAPFDPASLTPAAAGQRHINSLGMILLPLPDSRVLLAETELPAAIYDAYLQATSRSWLGRPSHISTPRHPVAGVSWREAQLFCEWLTRHQQAAGLIPQGARYRLPTDREWSAAAGLTEEEGKKAAQLSGLNTERFPWEGGWPPPPHAANLDAINIPGYADFHGRTCPVAAHDANALGFRELGGNVAEWCQDEWPEEKGRRVCRGGTWQDSDKDELLASRRRHALEDSAREDIGFRVALELPAANAPGTD